MFSFSFFFFISCLITSSSVQKISQSVNIISFKNCPEIWKIIQHNKIAPYTVECQDSVSDTGKITEETVLQFTCFLSKRILLYLCEKNVSINNEQLNTDYDTANSICPFDFKGLKNIGNLNLSVWEKELTNITHCNKVCLDIYETKTQCIILSKIINLMSNFASQAFDDKSQVIIKESEFEPNKDSISTIRQSHELATSGVHDKVKVNQNVPISKISNQKNSYTKQSQELLNLGTEESLKVKQSETPMINKVTVKTTQQAVSKVETTKIVQQTEKTLFIKKNPAINLSNEQKFKSTKQPFVKTTKNEPIFNIDNEETKTFPENQLNVDYVSEDINQPDDLASNQEFFKTQSEVNNKIYAGKGFFQAEESYFFFYFLMFSSLIIFGYLAFHNKNKILAYALEGSSGRRIRRRPNPARYRKLESNLEEAMTSNVSQAAESSVVY